MQPRPDPKIPLPLQTYASPRPESRLRRLLSSFLATIRGRVWITARVRGGGIQYVLGCYATEEEAVRRCRTPFDLIGPLEVGRSLPENPNDWEGRRYPLAEMSARLEAIRTLERARHEARMAPGAEENRPTDMPASLGEEKDVPEKAPWEGDPDG